MTDDALLDEQDVAIGDEALVALLQDEERLAVSFRDGDLAAEQELAIDYYEAKPFGDEEEGRSQVVTPDVAEVVDYMSISVLRTCVSGDRVVEFEAKEQEDVEAADEATEAVSYTFMRGQDGYKVLGDWLQSGLIEKYGVVKTSVVQEVRKRRERLKVEDEDTLSRVMDGEFGEPVAQTQLDDGALLIDVESRRATKRYLDMPIPSEEFLFSSRCRDVDDMGYKCHRTRKTLSELVEMGFDRDLVESLPESSPAYTDSRATSRWDDEILGGETKLPGMRRVWLCEEYVNVDRNDDGIAELLQVFRVGETILAIEEVEENPFAVFTPFPRAHRMVGNSLADKVMDIQRVRSVIMRGTLDGMYLTNNPRMWLPNECQTDDTIDDLLTVRPGGIVRGRSAGGHRPEPLYEPFDVQRGMAILELMTGERESRTGITRLNQGLDADALNKTATGTALMQAQGQQMEEYVARNFAEAMARLFAKKLRLMIATGDPIAVKVEGGFKTVDPKTWKPDLDVSIRVGLGSGRKDQRVLFRNQLLQFQQIALQAGLITPEHLYRNIAGWIRDTALGNPNDYWLDPNSEDGKAHVAQLAQNQQPDPKMAAVQQKAEADQAKLAQKAQADQTTAILKAHTEGAKLQQQMDKDVMEANLEMRRQDLEAELARQKSMTDLAGHAIKANRPGGSLAA